MNRFFAVIALAFLTPNTFAQDKSGSVRHWEHETSDIPVNPRIHFGKFDNGMRYAWMSNSEPSKRCYVRLHINVGSLGESETERGMAHFLEHMAFNGSKHFPANTLVEWFQRHGMAFGADSNAHTGFSETVYELDLPNSEEKTLGECFEFMRDVLDGLLLDDKEVQDERGVIDGEETASESASRRVLTQRLNLQFGGTLVANRLPIGKKEVRDKFNGKNVRAFYEKWYRPENATLVIVGDLKEFSPVELIKKYFADIKAPTTNPDREPALGKPTMEHKVFAIYEKEIPTVDIRIRRLKPWEDEPTNTKTVTRDLALSFANRMLNLRFSELAKKENAPFLGASVSQFNDLRVFEGEGLSVNCTPQKWKEALAFCEQELRRAIDHGFQETELHEIRSNYLRTLDEAVDREKTEASTSFLNDILGAVEDRGVPTDASTDRQIFKPAVVALTVEQCHKAFVNAWNEGTLSIVAIGNLDLGKDAHDILMKTYEESQKIKVEANKKIEDQSFAYASSPDVLGKVVNRKHVEDLDFEQIELENGVRVNIKKTTFKEKQVVLTARLGEGALTLEPEKFYMREVAGASFKGGGLAAHSEDELRRILAGKQAMVIFLVGEDSFMLGGATTKEDLQFECELMCAYLKAPGWRDEGLKQFQKMVVQAYARDEHELGGAVTRKFFPALYSGDPRFGKTPLEKLTGANVDAVKQWLKPHLESAPIELSFVGDLDVDATIKFVQQTFGTLPKRRALQSLDERRKAPAPKAGIRQDEKVDTTVQKSLVLTVFPATDGIETARRRNLSFLSTVLNDRVRLDIREKLGASYSPGASSRLSPIYPGDGMLLIQAIVEPDKVATVVEASLKVADALATSGVTEEEFNRLREPLMTRLRDQQRENSYWLNVLSQSQTKPETLDDARGLLDFYKEMKPETLTALAKQYLKKDRASVLVVNPQVKEEKTEEKKEEKKDEGTGKGQ